MAIVIPLRPPVAVVLAQLEDRLCAAFPDVDSSEIEKLIADARWQVHGCPDLDDYVAFIDTRVRTRLGARRPARATGWQE